MRSKDELNRSIEQAAQNILTDLMKPENLDLLIAVRDLGDDSAEQSFMFGFTQANTISFDDFCLITSQMDMFFQSLDKEPDYRSMSVRFDEYLEWLEKHNAAVSLGETQTKRFDAITSKYDDGWSGAIYGIMMRHVQAVIKQIFNG